MKKVGDGDWEKVTSLGEEMLITIDIEKDLLADGRVFYILRSHEGVVSMLFDQDDNPVTITIKTALFSTYAIAYTDNVEVAEAINSAADQEVTEQKAAPDEVEPPQAKGLPWWFILLLIAIVCAIIGTLVYKKRSKDDHSPKGGNI